MNFSDIPIELLRPILASLFTDQLTLYHGMRKVLDLRAVCKVFNHEIIMLLLERGEMGWVLRWAAFCGHEGVLQWLLERNDVDLNSKGNFGQTTLWWAASSGLWVADSKCEAWIYSIGGSCRWKSATTT